MKTYKILVLFSLIINCTFYGMQSLTIPKPGLFQSAHPAKFFSTPRISIFDSLENKSISNEIILKILSEMRTQLNSSEVSTTSSKLPILNWAIVHKRSELIPALIAKGANPFMVDRYGNNALHAAVYENDRSATSFLLHHYPLLIQQKNENDFLPLHLIAMRGMTGFIKKIKHAGIDINEPTKWGETPLYLAVNYDHLELVKELLRHGANPTIATHLGETPKSIAQKRVAQGEDGIAKKTLNLL